MSFFDDDDEPTRVTNAPRRPAQPRRPSGAAARPQTGGGSGHPPPDRQTARTRQAIAIGGGLLLLILIVFGFKGCLDSRKDRALKDYVRDASSIIEDSNSQVTKPFFELLSGGNASGRDLQVQVNQVRLTADEDAKRAKELSIPGDMRSAQQNLELVLNLRSEALTDIAEKLPAAQGRGQAAEQATNEIAGQMQKFLASDVVYSQRTAPLMLQALDENGVSGQTIPPSVSLPGYTWLAPETVAGAIGGTTGGGTTGSGGASGTCPEGTSCGHGVLGTSINGTDLQPDGASNKVTGKPPVPVVVKFANQGDNNQKDVVVELKLTAPGFAGDAQKKTVNQTTAGQEVSVTIPLAKVPPAGSVGTLTVKVDPVAGEKNTDNNQATYTVIFSG
jgi:hypothetical protein